MLFSFYSMDNIINSYYSVNCHRYRYVYVCVHHHNILFMITVNRYVCNYKYIYNIYYNIHRAIPIYKWIDK